MYLMVSDGIISNIIVADEAFAESTGAKPYYSGASIGAAYDPPTLDKLQATTADIAEIVANLLYQQDLNNIGGTTT